MNWDERFKNFSKDELKCQHCGAHGINLEFLDDIQLLREQYGKPMVVTSAYRCPEHPIEAKKARPGEHSEGLAIDFAVPTEDFLMISWLWYSLGYQRVGWNPGSFIHLGGSKVRPQTVWTY